MKADTRNRTDTRICGLRRRGRVSGTPRADKECTPGGGLVPAGVSLLRHRDRARHVVERAVIRAMVRIRARLSEREGEGSRRGRTAARRIWTRVVGVSGSDILAIPDAGVVARR